MAQGQETWTGGKEFVGPVTITGDLVVTGETTLGEPSIRDHNTGITAFATGGQASATALVGLYNDVTVCATAGDSVKLLTAEAGLTQIVKNSGATALAVFPATGDSINALAVNLSVDIPPGGEVSFRAISATVWETQESLYVPAPTTQTGGLEVKATASAGNTTTTVTNASQAAARTYTIPDAGASASFLMTEGAQVANGILTLSAAPVVQAGPVLPWLTAANVGTPGANVTALEYGDGHNHLTVLTLTAVELAPTIPADAEGAGVVIYTFPAGVYAGHMARLKTTAAVVDTATNAADVGLGSLIASGDIATLTNAAMEDWLTGQTVADVSTFVVDKATIMTAGVPLVFEASDSHILHLNAAATWNATVAMLTVTGTVWIMWTYLGA
jgi:hypothetical protein